MKSIKYFDKTAQEGQKRCFCFPVPFSMKKEES